MQCGQKRTNQAQPYSYRMETANFIQIQLIGNVIAFKLCNRYCCYWC